jgi:hypothetical protein
MDRLEGRFATVTEGSQGLGRAVVGRLVPEGARLSRARIGTPSSARDSIIACNERSTSHGE